MSNAVLTSGNRLPKNSFERLGDDLSQLILSHLSFQDKFRFECLSKQWQTLVFNRLTKLWIGFSEKFEYRYRFEMKSTINLLSLESILKKCSNITFISVHKGVKNTEQVFQLILKYVTNLTKIIADFNGLSETTFKHFFNKFGSNLKTVIIRSDIGKNINVLKLCPNIEVIDFFQCERPSLSFIENNIVSNQLKQMGITYTSDDDNRTKLLVNKYINTLESLKVFIKDVNTTEAINRLMGEISKLLKLKHLQIVERRTTANGIDDSFVEVFIRIGQNCRQLSYLSICLKTISSDVNYNLFMALNQFKNLRKLSLHLEAINESKPFVLTSKMLNNCQNLTHLTIDGKPHPTDLLNDEFFTDIDKHLPKLQYLSIQILMITDHTFESLSKLCDLRQIRLFEIESNALISDSIVVKVMEKCLKLNFIYFRIIDSNNTYLKRCYLSDQHIFELRAKGLSSLKYVGSLNPLYYR